MRFLLRPVLLAAGAIATVVGAAVPAAPASALPSPPDWRNPVSGELARPFRPGSHAYAAGAHRGIDLVARPGQPVRSACPGRVAFAGVVAGRPVVSVACGSWRATHLPVIEPRVAAGGRVGPGQVLGVLGDDDTHAGLHLGVRRADSRSGYVDPWLLLSSPGIGDRPGAAPSARRKPPRPTGWRAPRLVPRAAPAPAPSPHAERRVAPPLAWVGLACVLAGCLGAGRRANRRRVPAPRTRRSPGRPALNGHVRSRTGRGSRPR